MAVIKEERKEDRTLILLDIHGIWLVETVQL